MKHFSATTRLSLITISLISLIASPFAHAVAPAEAGQALEIAPPVLNLTADPGQVINAEIALRDVSPTSLVVTSEVNDFTANPDAENGSPKILLDTNERTPYSLIDWVSPLPKMTLKSKQVENLPVKITVPKNAAPGGYYGTIRFTAKAPDMQETGVSLSASLGALLMVRVNGDAKESMTVLEFSVTKDGTKGWLFDSLPITFTERVKNEGNVFEQPRGNIILKNLFGQTIANINVNLESRNVLPSSIRKFEQEFTAHDLGNTFMFGPYTAELTLDYGNNHQKITGKTSFWILPWKLIIGIIVLIVVLILAARLALQRHNDKIVRRSRGTRRR